MDNDHLRHSRLMGGLEWHWLDLRAGMSCSVGDVMGYHGGLERILNRPILVWPLRMPERLLRECQELLCVFGK